MRKVSLLLLTAHQALAGHVARAQLAKLDVMDETVPCSVSCADCRAAPQSKASDEECAICSSNSDTRCRLIPVSLCRCSAFHVICADAVSTSPSLTDADCINLCEDASEHPHVRRAFTLGCHISPATESEILLAQKAGPSEAVVFDVQLMNPTAVMLGEEQSPLFSPELSAAATISDATIEPDSDVIGRIVLQSLMSPPDACPRCTLGRLAAFNPPVICGPRGPLTNESIEWPLYPPTADGVCVPRKKASRLNKPSRTPEPELVVAAVPPAVCTSNINPVEPVIPAPIIDPVNRDKLASAVSLLELSGGDVPEASRAKYDALLGKAKNLLRIIDEANAGAAAAVTPMAVENSAADLAKLQGAMERLTEFAQLQLAVKQQV